MSNTSPLEPCPPDGVKTAVAEAGNKLSNGFFLLEPEHETDLGKEELLLTTVDDGSSISSHVKEGKVEAVDEHQDPRPELQNLVHAQAIESRANDVQKRESRVSIPSDQGDLSGTTSANRQSIYLVEEDIQLHLRFYRRQIVMMVLWYTLCLVTGGIWFVIDSWANNKFWIRWNTTPITLASNSSSSSSSSKNRGVLIKIKSKHGEVDILPLKRVPFSTPLSLAHVFPPSLTEPFESAEQAAHQLSTPVVSGKEDTTQDAMLEYVDLLEYRATTFLLHPGTGKFRQLASWRDPNWASAVGSDTSLAATGLSSQLVSDRQTLFGPNQVSVRGKSVADIMIEEVLHPFYIFQIYSIVLWCNDEYVPYAIVIGVVSLIGIVTTTVTTKAAIEKLKKMSRFSCQTSVLRQENAENLESPTDQTEKSLTTSSQWTRLNSERLVPGDIVDLGAAMDDHAAHSQLQQHRLVEILPCDLVLLEGDCIVNESMLTGESVPVVKSPVSRADLSASLADGQDLAKLNKNVLYSGTKLIRVRPGSANSTTTKAMVIRTGFSTAKGSLVRQMLFPRPISHKFYRDAFYFIGNLFVIAMIGMIATIIYFQIIGVSGEEIALRSLDVLTIAVPPALPATLSICITFSIARLKKAQIFCLSPQRINVAGMVNMFVFDKTGTLTEEGLDVLGVRRVQDGQFSDLVDKPIESDGMPRDDQLDLYEAMATAHDLNLLDNEPIGEPLEVKMLEWTTRQLQDDAGSAPIYLLKQDQPAPAPLESARRPTNKDGVLARVPVVLPHHGSSSALAVVRMFEFSASLRRMSVVVKRENQVSAQVYCKGAPESIVSLCSATSLPHDYSDVLDRCTRAGFRVLAVAGKTIGSMGWQGAQSLTRNQAESNMQFLGLIIFENKLKAGTRSTIDTIRQDAQLPIKMCTGDSVLTAVSVGKECGMLSSSADVYVARLATTSEQEKAKTSIQWASVDSDTDMLDPYSLDPLTGSKALKDIELAVSGEILRVLVDTTSPETLARVLVHCKIFGRFSPEQKQELVERLQTLGYVVAFTGDGANDCGALKSADVGLSLSEAEASVAAPFTSRHKDISAITHLIREGRSTLSVSFAMFKWMSCYSLAEYFTVVLLYGKATSLDNAEYLFIDVFIVLPVAVGLANSRPANKLWKIPPDARLASSKPVISMLGQVILGFLAQTVVYVVLHGKTWYETPFFDPEDLTLNDMDNTALFKVSVFSYIIAGFVYSYGRPHRQLLIFNWFLAAALIILTIFGFYFLFLTGGPFFTLFGFVDMPKSFFWIIFGVVIAQFVLGMLFEFVALDCTARMIAKPFNGLKTKLGSKAQKQYQQVEKTIYRT